MTSTTPHPALVSYRPFVGSEGHAATEDKIADVGSAYRLYRRVAGTWAAVFVVAGLAFVLAPAFVGTGLVTLANALGLRGEVPTAPGSLWFVLTGSLMATISMLSFQTARRPDESAPYVSLMTAKLVSTVAFLCLARQANVWLLCAACDGFIALTLAAARSHGDRAMGRLDFVSRYLRSLGVSERGVREYATRTQRLPRFARIGVWAAVFVIGLAAPFFLLGTWSRAARLGDAEFAQLTDRLNHSPLPVVRGLWLMVHRPALSIIAQARAPEYRA